MLMRLNSRSIPSFFGPVHSWRKDFLEASFLLQRHLNMSYSEVKNLPIAYRKWYIDRLVEEFRKKNDANDTADQDGNHDNMNKLRQYEDMLSNKS